MYVPRGITKEFLSASESGGIVALVGPRQSGKTTFLKEQSARDGFAYVMFDDPDVKELFDLDIKRFDNQYVTGNKITVLDEVQYGKDPGRKLKYLSDIGRKLWITSSSQVLLSKDVLGWLVGRVSIIRLYPFSFNEFLAAKGQKEVTDAIAERLIEEHIIYGGYPKVVLEEDRQNKETLLRNLYETMLLKDVARLFNIGDIALLERLAAYLSHQIGNVLVYNNACKELGIAFQSLKKYLDAMEKSYIIVMLPPFYKNKTKEIVKQHKLYFLDTGLRNAVANNFSISPEIKGRLFENYVLSELVKSGQNVKYWQSKGRAEVDFVVQAGSEAIPIEAKSTASGGVVERSMLEFIDSYKPKRGFVVFSHGVRSETKINGCAVNFVNLPTLLSKLSKKR